MRGLRIFDSNASSVVERINIRNNIVLNCNSYSYDVVDNTGDVESDCDDTDCIKWNNNIAYGYTSGNFGRIEGSAKSTDTLFNTAVAGTENATPNNDDIDPELQNEASGQFWPEDTGANVLQAGYDTGASLDDFLTELEISDWSQNVGAGDLQQEDTHHIGPFTLLSASPTASGNIIFNSGGSGKITYDSTGSGKITR